MERFQRAAAARRTAKNAEGSALLKSIEPAAENLLRGHNFVFVK
jgi:hypothetical protein